MWMMLAAVAGEAGDVVLVVGVSADETPDVPEDVPREEPDETTEPDPEEDARGKGELQLGTAVEFLDGMLAQSFNGRIESRRDAYLDSAVRIHPCCWVGRLGAGMDVFGDGPLDLTFGLFLGAFGETVAFGDRLQLSTAPQAGGQAALGYDGRHLFTRYTWTAGWGGGGLDGALTENQFVLGFRVARVAEIYGEYLVLAPGTPPGGTGIGLGARIVL